MVPDSNKFALIRSEGRGSVRKQLVLRTASTYQLLVKARTKLITLKLAIKIVLSVKNVSVTLWFCLQCSCKKWLQPCDSAGFNALYYVLFCLFLSTCVLQSVCVHTMDFVSAHKQINK